MGPQQCTLYTYTATLHRRSVYIFIRLSTTPFTLHQVHELRWCCILLDNLKRRRLQLQRAVHSSQNILRLVSNKDIGSFTATLRQISKSFSRLIHELTLDHHRGVTLQRAVCSSSEGCWQVMTMCFPASWVLELFRRGRRDDRRRAKRRAAPGGGAEGLGGGGAWLLDDPLRREAAVAGLVTVASPLFPGVVWG